MTGSRQDRKRFDEISKTEQTGQDWSRTGNRTVQDRGHGSGLA